MSNKSLTNAEAIAICKREIAQAEVQIAHYYPRYGAMHDEVLAASAEIERANRQIKLMGGGW